jgi:hypothetical protein
LLESCSYLVRYGNKENKVNIVLFLLLLLRSILLCPV